MFCLFCFGFLVFVFVLFSAHRYQCHITQVHSLTIQDEILSIWCKQNNKIECEWFLIYFQTSYIDYHLFVLFLTHPHVASRLDVYISDNNNYSLHIQVDLMSTTLFSHIMTDNSTSLFVSRSHIYSNTITSCLQWDRSHKTETKHFKTSSTPWILLNFMSHWTWRLRTPVVQLIG